VARTRSIKPAFFDNDVLAGLPPLTRLLFIGLWGIADRDGRLEDRPKKINKMILGYDKKTDEEADEMLQQLADNGFIIRYKVGDTAYIQVTNFMKHQNPNKKEKASEIPPPEGYTLGSYVPPESYQTAQESQEESEPEETPDEPKEETSAKRTAARELNKLRQERFEIFYKAYPKKVKKKKAEEIWMRLKLDDTLFKAIMDGLERSKNSSNWHRGYVPDPTTWLNGEQWNDEPEPWHGEEDRQNGFSRSIPSVPTAEPKREGTGTPAGFRPAATGD
jgi:hypothetical protein